MTTDGRAAPDLDTFRSLARERRVIPVHRRVLADGLTPVAAYRALAAGRPGTFLLESAEHGQWARYSFVGVASAAMLTADASGDARWIGRVPVGVPTQGRAIDVLAGTAAALATPAHPDLPPFTSGLVGYLSYDVVRHWERLPDANPDELGIPELGMLLATDIAAVDHTDGSVTLIANAINFDGSAEGVDEAWADAVARLDRMTVDLATAPPVPVMVMDPSAAVEVHSRSERDDYLAGVEAAREHIRAGDAFQIVLSQRFTAPCAADAFDVYRVLRATNPSPYMFLIRLPDTDSGDMTAPCGWDIVGSSPEALVTVVDGQATMHPIAGTRPRGNDPEHDARLADELLADEKERSEHLMLVDLGRNDLGRVCAPGSVEVVEFMAVERYSHVMHLVSTVVGRLADGRTAFDALAATFPAGTLSGAPKPRAMEIIDDLEPVRRGLYGGAVGYVDFAGGSDTAIAIRTALIRNNVAYVQAGAGLVADSDPVREDQECRDKAAAVLRAVAVAATMAPADGPRQTERAK
ncbi:MAG: anthranilate synthase component I [Candidatus Nanopelagicales bacterium]